MKRRISIINDEISPNIKQSVAFLKKNHLSFVEFRSANGVNVLDLSLQEVTHISELFKRNQIRVAALASPLFKWYPEGGKPLANISVDSFFSSPILSAEEKRQYILKAMRIAKIFKAPYIRVFSSLRSTSTSYNFWEDPLLRIAISEARRNRIGLLLENEPVCTLSTYEEMDEIFQRFSLNELGFWFDVANLAKIDPVPIGDYVRKYGKRIKHIHLKDVDTVKKEYVPFGTGDLNYKKYLSDIERSVPKRVALSLEPHIQHLGKHGLEISIKNLKSMAEMQRVRYGVIGCGRIFEKHASAIKSDFHSELGGVYDTNQNKSAAAARKNGCTLYADANQLLSDPQIKVVTIATPHDTHAKLVERVSKTGKYCLCEKPLYISRREKRKMKKIAESKKVFLVLQKRFNPAVKFLFDVLDNGALGKLHTCDVTVRWWRDHNYFNDEWHGKRKRVGGMLYNQGAHILDLMLSICGKPKKVFRLVKSMRYNSEVDDVYKGLVQFANGMTGTINVTSLAPDKNYEESIYVAGDKGSIKIGGSGLNVVEHIGFRGKRTLPTGNSTESYYGNGHKELIARLSSSILKRKVDRAIPTVVDGIELSEFIRGLY